MADKTKEKLLWSWLKDLAKAEQQLTKRRQEIIQAITMGGVPAWAVVDYNRSAALVNAEIMLAADLRRRYVNPQTPAPTLLPLMGSATNREKCTVEGVAETTIFGGGDLRVCPVNVPGAQSTAGSGPLNGNQNLGFPWVAVVVIGGLIILAYEAKQISDSWSGAEIVRIQQRAYRMQLDATQQRWDRMQSLVQQCAGPNPTPQNFRACMGKVGTAVPSVPAPDIKIPRGFWATLATLIGVGFVGYIGWRVYQGWSERREYANLPPPRGKAASSSAMTAEDEA